MACECELDLDMPDMSEVETESDVKSDDTTSVTSAELKFEYYHLDSFTSLQPTWRQKSQASRDELILDAISATVAGFLWGEGDIGQHPGCDMKLLPVIEGPSTSGVKPCSRCTPRNNPMDHPTIVDSVPGMLGVAYKLILETRGDINADNYYMDCDVLPEDRSDCRIPDYSSIFPQPKPTSTEYRRLPQAEENPFPAPSLFHHFRRLFRRLRRAAAL